MLEPGEVVYGFVKDIHPPKHKYLVTIYRDDDLQIVACFTTTQNRVGIPLESLKHGYVSKDGDIIGYFFDKNIAVGANPKTSEDFKFPRNCVIPFAYCIKEGTKEALLAGIDNAEVVCRLSPKEYEDIVYAMMCSPHTNAKHKPYLDKVLQQLYENLG